MTGLEYNLEDVAVVSIPIGEERRDQLATPAMATVEGVVTHSVSLIAADLCFTVYQVPSHLLSEHNTAIAISQMKMLKIRSPASLQPPGLE